MAQTPLSQLPSMPPSRQRPARAVPAADKRLWEHLQRGSAFGPPPLNVGRDTPWLLTGRPHDPQVTPRATVRTFAAAPPPSHAETHASRRRRMSLAIDNRNPQLQPSTNSTGPCPERALPLSKHTPRQLVTRAERKNPPKWQPNLEWRSWNMRPGDMPTDAPNTLPLSNFSPNVVEQCTVTHEEHEREVQARAWEESMQWVRVTGGGWAVDVKTPPPLPADALPESDPAWPIEEEAMHWAGRAAAHAQPRGTLALVDDFLNGPFAADLVPVELQ